MTSCTGRGEGEMPSTVAPASECLDQLSSGHVPGHQDGSGRHSDGCYMYRATNPEKFAMRGQFYAKKTIRMWGSSFSFGEPFLFADLDLLRGVSDAKTMQSKEDQSKIVVDLLITNWESETRWLKSSLNAKPFVVLEAHTNSACARSQSSWFKGKKKKSLTDSHKLWYKI